MQAHQPHLTLIKYLSCCKVASKEAQQSSTAPLNPGHLIGSKAKGLHKLCQHYSNFLASPIMSETIQINLGFNKMKLYFTCVSQLYIWSVYLKKMEILILILYEIWEKRYISLILNYSTPYIMMLWNAWLWSNFLSSFSAEN